MVLHTLNPAAGGVMSATAELAFALAARGHEVSLVSLDAPDAPFLKNIPANISVCALGAGFTSYGFLPGLSDKLQNFSFDFLILNGLWLYSTAGVARWAVKNKIPYVLFPHGMLDSYFHRFPLKHFKKLVYWLLVERHTVRGAAALAYTTASELSFAQKSFPGFWPRRQELIGLGLRSCEIPVSQAKDAFYHRFPGLKGKSFLLYLSRFDPKKAPELLLQALKEFPELHLVMAGPPERTEFYRQLHAIALPGQVTWTGLLTGDVKWGALAAAQALVLPSHQENFGMVVAEALSVGTPVLLSDQVALSSDVMRTRCGLVEHDTLLGVRALLTKFQRLSQDDLVAIKDRAVTCYRDNYQPSIVAERLEKLLKELVK